MIERLSPKNHGRSHTRPLRLGFVPLNDCAPIVMAHELGLFEKYDLVVKLSREIGWATVRDKIVYGAPEGLSNGPCAESARQRDYTFQRVAGMRRA
jgi:ABC-type nitrate/sulfonate/bicarbonate transport system substrate-binding protein